LQEKDAFIKEINKLMLSKIFEIVIVITLVCLSIPAWNVFAAKMNNVDIIRLEDCKLNFKQIKDQDIDYLTIENIYAFNKNYKIYLEINKNINPNEIELKINNKEYILANFYSEEVGNNLKFTLIDKNLVATAHSYSIRLTSDIIIPEYRYIFEENNKI